MCLAGSERRGPPPALGHLGCLALPPQKQLPGEMGQPAPMGAAALASGAACVSRGRKFFSLRFQDKVSFMRAACWTNQVNWETLNSSHWANPSFLLKADSADGEITSALNSFSASLNFTPISGWGESEQTCDMGVVQFSFAGSKACFVVFCFFFLSSSLWLFFSATGASQLSWCQGHPADLRQLEWCKLLHCFGKIERTNPVLWLPLDWPALDCC